MDAKPTPFIFKSSKMQTRVQYDASQSIARFAQYGPQDDSAKRYVANWLEAEREREKKRR